MPHAMLTQGSDPTLGVSLREKYLSRQVTSLRTKKKAFLPEVACLPSLQGNSGFFGVPCVGVSQEPQKEPGWPWSGFTFTASQLEFTRCCRKGPKPETKDNQGCLNQPTTPSYKFCHPVTSSHRPQRTTTSLNWGLPQNCLYET